MNKLIYSISVTIIFIIPLLLGYIFKLYIFSINKYTVGIYGLLLFIYLFLQNLFTNLNNIKNNQLRLPQFIHDIIGISVVGYKEDPVLFKNCLLSVKKIMEKGDYCRLVVCSDGNETEDVRKMGLIFKEVFIEGMVYENIPLFSMCDVNTAKPIFIFQKHISKRAAMYTSFSILYSYFDVKYILTTDSDTILNENCLQKLHRVISSDDNIGAVTGDVKIWNIFSFVAFMSSLRYWFAFNVERGCQSFHGCVTCVSGPLGMYRVSVIRDIIDKWINQRFLGENCTYGDDRHLTGLVLLQGKNVKYTIDAFCETDTPITISKFIKQQTRWNKSFFREIFWTIPSFGIHSPWLALEITYQLFYSIIVIYTIINTLFVKNTISLLIFIYIIMLISFIKSIYAIIMTHEFKLYFL